MSKCAVVWSSSGQRVPKKSSEGENRNLGFMAEKWKPARSLGTAAHHMAIEQKIPLQGPHTIRINRSNYDLSHG